MERIKRPREMKRKLSMISDESLEMGPSAKGKKDANLASSESTIYASWTAAIQALSIDSTAPYHLAADERNSNAATSSSSAIQTYPPLTEFHCFSAFPAEIRNKIWKFSFLHQQRTVAARPSINGKIISYSNTFSASAIPTLLVNWEARMEALRHYARPGDTFLFNRNQDSLYLTCCCPTYGWPRKLTPELREQIYSLRIKHLVLSESDWLKNIRFWPFMKSREEDTSRNGFLRMLVGMTELETISVVTTKRKAHVEISTSHYILRPNRYDKSPMEKTKRFVSNLFLKYAQIDFDEEWKIPTLIYRKDELVRSKRPIKDPCSRIENEERPPGTKRLGME
ncbi:hypothetical protein SBOR_4164 [Sclerotinia borealis F-4128]|uniref:2EXR domain-containing protein n=1 Tax=Sclerotinia borealis (strain F-4128) TaxID=1432307 RepID=W9CHJ7_SCLBF|nr:hypothetical protein SBOR_4164 [Sclerotinia borealis F-4128]